ARQHRLAVHQHRAGPALPQLAAVLGAGQREVLAQHLEEGFVDGDDDLALLPVDLEREPSLHGDLATKGDYRSMKLRFIISKSAAATLSRGPAGGGVSLLISLPGQQCYASISLRQGYVSSLTEPGSSARELITGCGGWICRMLHAARQPLD